MTAVVPMNDGGTVVMELGVTGSKQELIDNDNDDNDYDELEENVEPVKEEVQKKKKTTERKKLNEVCAMASTLSCFTNASNLAASDFHPCAYCITDYRTIGH